MNIVVITSIALLGGFDCLLVLLQLVFRHAFLLCAVIETIGVISCAELYLEFIVDVLNLHMHAERSDEYSHGLLVMIISGRLSIDIASQPLRNQHRCHRRGRLRRFVHDRMGSTTLQTQP